METGRNAFLSDLLQIFQPRGLKPQQLYILNEDFQIRQEVILGPYLLLFLGKPHDIGLISKFLKAIYLHTLTEFLRVKVHPLRNWAMLKMFHCALQGPTDFLWFCFFKDIAVRYNAMEGLYPLASRM